MPPVGMSYSEMYSLQARPAITMLSSPKCTKLAAAGGDNNIDSSEVERGGMGSLLPDGGHGDTVGDSGDGSDGDDGGGLAAAAAVAATQLIETEAFDTELDAEKINAEADESGGVLDVPVAVEVQRVQDKRMFSVSLKSLAEQEHDGVSANEAVVETVFATDDQCNVSGEVEFVTVTRPPSVKPGQMIWVRNWISELEIGVEYDAAEGDVFEVFVGDADAMSDDEGDADLVVVVPEGCAAGDMIVVDVDGGATVEVQIPEGRVPGDEFDVVL